MDESSGITPYMLARASVNSWILKRIKRYVATYDYPSLGVEDFFKEPENQRVLKILNKSGLSIDYLKTKIPG